MDFTQKDFERAVTFAVNAHAGMRRKTKTTPYILHPMEVASIAGTMTEDLTIIAASVLHDTVEDTDVTIEDIKKEFGDRVAALVASETENKRPDIPPDQSWEIRKKESLEELKNCNDIGVKIIWISDKLSNVRSFYYEYLQHGNSFWKNFNQSDEKKQEWYYRSIAEYTKELCDFPAWKEYCVYCDLIFGGENGERYGKI